MAPAVFLAVLFGAVMHACYHAIIKMGDDKVAGLGVIAVFETLYGAIGSFIFPAPPAAAWFWLVLAVAVQTLYRLLACFAYRYGDLSQVMPIVRGTAPLLVTAASALFLGEHLNHIQMIAILLIAIGIMTLGFARSATGHWDHRAAILAGLSGVSVATYSIIDGIGARTAGSAASYVWWLTMVGGIAFVIPAFAFKPEATFDLLKRKWHPGLIGAAFSTSTYWIVIWAMTQAPIGLVSALRETGVIFAVLIGIFYLKERPGRMRIAAVGLATAGIALLKLAA